MKSLSSILRDSKKGAPILLYHSTFSSPPTTLGPAVHNIPPDLLYEQLACFQQTHTFVQLDTLLSLKSYKGVAALTFDDGFQSVLTEALPVLESLNIPATIFLNGTCLEGNILWREKVQFIVLNKLEEQWEKFSDKRFNINDLPFALYSRNPKNHSREVDRTISEFLDLVDTRLLTRHTIGSAQELIEHKLIQYGNHTHDHYVLSSLTEDEILNQILRTDTLLKNASLSIPVSKLVSIPFGSDWSTTETVPRSVHNSSYAGLLMNRGKVNIEPHQESGVWIFDRIALSEKHLPTKQRYYHSSLAT